MNEIVKNDNGVLHVYKTACPCHKEDRVVKESLPPMILVDNCECEWELSKTVIDGVEYWTIDGVILVDRNWNAVPTTKLILK